MHAALDKLGLLGCLLGEPWQGAEQDGPLADWLIKQWEHAPGWISILASKALALVEKTVPRYTWPWALLRAPVFVFTGKGNYVGYELDGLYRADRAGPLAALAVTWLPFLGEEPVAAFRAKGLQQLDVAHFMEDCQPLLDRGTYAGAALHGLLANLATLDDAQLGAFATLLPPDAGRALREAVPALRAGRDKPGARADEAFLGLLWEGWLAARVRQALTPVVETPAAPAEAPAAPKKGHAVTVKPGASKIKPGASAAPAATKPGTTKPGAAKDQKSR